MRKIFSLMAFLFAVSLSAQEVVPYAMVKQNATITYALLRGEKKKLNFGICYYKLAVNSVTTNEDSTKTVVYRTDMLDKKLSNSDYASSIGVENGFFNQIIIAADGSYAMDQDYAYGYGKDMARGGFMFKVPGTLTVGQTLESGTVNQQYVMMRTKMFSTLAYNDVKVIGEEDYVTPAGTFHCYVITYNVSGTANKRNINDESVTIWLAPDFGIVCYKYISGGTPIYVEMCEYEGIK